MLKATTEDFQENDKVLESINLDIAKKYKS